MKEQQADCQGLPSALLSYQHVPCQHTWLAASHPVWVLLYMGLGRYLGYGDVEIRAGEVAGFNMQYTGTW